MKIAVWIEAVNAEQDYVRKEPLRKRGPYRGEIHMQTLMKKKRNMEIAQIIDDALYDYYSEQGRPVPLWKKKNIIGGENT